MNWSLVTLEMLSLHLGGDCLFFNTGHQRGRQVGVLFLALISKVTEVALSYVSNEHLAVLANLVQYLKTKSGKKNGEEFMV